MIPVITSRMKPSGAQPGDLYIYTSPRLVEDVRPSGSVNLVQRTLLLRWTADDRWELLEERTLPAREMYERESRNRQGDLGAYASYLPRQEYADAEIEALREYAAARRFYVVSANGTYLGTYFAVSEQQARDLCARDAVYGPEADLIERLGKSELAVELCVGKRKK